MMNPVHARRNENQVQNALDINWQAPIGMMKKCCHFEAQEKNEQHDRRDPESHDGQCEEPNGKNHFAEMKSRRRAHIKVEAVWCTLWNRQKSGIIWLAQCHHQYA